MQIDHVVVLMLENRSFDAMLGRLYPSGPGFDGLVGNEFNPWHHGPSPHREAAVTTIPAWNNHGMGPHTATMPDPDPGELFDDIGMQLFGLAPPPGAPATMSGFVDNYMRQTLKAGEPPPMPEAVMHGFAPEQLPVLSGLARAFGVSDRWFASAPCQTWPNRFFAHTGTAGGWVNNLPAHWLCARSVYRQLGRRGKSWRLYFHDLPQAAMVCDLWPALPFHFRLFERDFAEDARTGRLPSYSFIEPRYFPDPGGAPPNDQHPPHDVAYGEALIATVYNALRGGEHWLRTLLIVTYDEHGGCYDHVAPPPATPPGGRNRSGFAFDRFGVRVPAVIASPHIPAGSIIRPDGPVPFDHSSIIRTVERLFALGDPLNPRVAAAPDLLSALSLPQPENLGPETLTPLPVQTGRAAASRSLPYNHHQRALRRPAALPAHVARFFAHRHKPSPSR